MKQPPVPVKHTCPQQGIKIHTVIAGYDTTGINRFGKSAQLPLMQQLRFRKM